MIVRDGDGSADHLQKSAMRRWGRRNASTYGIWARLLGLFGYREMMRRVARMLPLADRILDVGCGNGEALSVIREDPRRGGGALACDLSPELVRVARRRFRTIPFFVSDAEELAVRSASCAAALSYGVLGHLRDPAGASRELARVVRPGGLIVVWTRTESLPSRAIAFLFERINRGNAFHLHDPRAVRRALEDYGVRVLSEETIAGGRLWIGQRRQSSTDQRIGK